MSVHQIGADCPPGFSSVLSRDGRCVPLAGMVSGSDCPPGFSSVLSPDGRCVPLAGSGSNCPPGFSSTLGVDGRCVPVPPVAPDVILSELIPSTSKESAVFATDTMNVFSESFVHKKIGGFLLKRIPGVSAVTDIVDLFGGGGGGGQQFAGPPPDRCPGGIELPGGRCFQTPFVPKLPVGGGDVTPGAFGALSVDATMVSAVKLRCPPGLVLGKDDRCYAQGKGGISNSQRKWPKAPRAIMSAQDGKILRRAEAVRGRVKRVAKSAGFTCKSK